MILHSSSIKCWQGILVNTRGFKGAHFAVYPEELLHRPVLSSSRVGDIVLDPFIGSGTTSVVAKRFGRRFVGCDINPEYLKIAANRLRRDAIGQLNPDSGEYTSFG